MRLDLARTLAHHRQEMIVDPRLVDDHVRHFRQIVGNVLDPAAADDPVRVRVIRLPEGGLVHLIALLDHLIGETVGLEHLDRAAGNAVGLADQQSVVLLLDDAGVDLRKL